MKLIKIARSDSGANQVVSPLVDVLRTYGDEIRSDLYSMDIAHSRSRHSHALVPDLNGTTKTTSGKIIRSWERYSISYLMIMQIARKAC